MVHAQTVNRFMWRLELCTAADKPAMRRLLQRTMYEDEPLASTYDESCKEALAQDETGLTILEEGHSVKAVTEDGRIVGAAINKMCPYNLDEYEPVQHVKDFLRSVDAKKPMDCEGLLDMYMLAVDPDFRRQGMAKALGQAAVMYAKKEGFRGMKITASSQYTTNIAKSLGFRVFNSVAYADYKDEAGRVVFSPPAPHTHINIMLKEFDKESKI
uniref:Alcohol dehydrogenase 2 n=2 Tax=Lygus hesperus TaxID=30085 RepID=A0A0A9YBW7_LYGHE